MVSPVLGNPWTGVAEPATLRGTGDAEPHYMDQALACANSAELFGVLPNKQASGPQSSD